MGVIVIDNFLPYPDIVRSWALQQKFYTAKEFTTLHNQHTDWPGTRSLHLSDLNSQYADNVLTIISNLAYKHFDLKNVSIKAYFQHTTKNDGDSWVHQDNDVDLAALLYLSPNAPINSGTSLYKCNDITKWTSFMSSTEGYNVLKNINRHDNVDLYNELFTQTDIIGNVYNRLVMYPGYEFHKSNDYFGDSLETGRLTQVMFLKSE